MSVKEAEVVTPEPTTKRAKAIAKRNGTQALEIIPHQPTMEEVLMRAVEQGASIETLERIAAMIEKAQAATARREFFEALSRFQAVMPVIPKKKRVMNNNGGVRFSYAPIEVIKEMAKPHLAANGLSVTTGSKVVDNKLIATATANHIGGHSESRDFEVPITLSQFMSDQQAFAAASSFAERHAFRQVTGIVCADDDNESRIAPNEAREAKARQPVTQPRQTPTAQKNESAKTNGKRRELEPAPEGEGIPENIAKGLWAAMQHATLGMEEFKKRFPKLERLGEIRKGDEQVIMSWIADPVKN